MTKYLLLIPLLAGWFTAGAQQRFIAKDRAAHAYWMDSLARQPLQQQQQMIANRLTGDTAIAFQRPVCVVGFTGEQRKKLQANETERLKNKITGIPAPLIIINGNLVNGDYYSTPDPVKYLALSWFISTASFKKIEVLTDAASVAIYGSRAANGLLVMELTDKKELKPLQALYPEKDFVSVKYNNNKLHSVHMERYGKTLRLNNLDKVAFARNDDPPVTPWQA